MDEANDTVAQDRLELPIEGMTCASCATRVEKRLNEVEGVAATVNYATERATVRFDSARAAPDRLLEAVRSAGYDASLPGDDQQRAEHDEEGETASLRRRLILSAVLSLPLLAVAMVPALQFDYWQWFALVLATPVVLWGG